MVQSSRPIVGGYELYFGTSGSADYAFIDGRVLLQEPAALIAIQRDSKAILTIGNQFVGKRIRISGEVQKDTAGRRYIRVNERAQIEYL